MAPIRPKSLGVSTSPRPKWCCQTRLTIDRQVSGFRGSVIQRARAARRADSSLAGRDGEPRRQSGRRSSARPGAAGLPG